MDCLFLSYADPALATGVILGHFESAPHLQQPCMREDGSYSMVADDGQLCGTAPDWGYPLWCCDQLFRRTGDVEWLSRLYPKAADYVHWWLQHRRDTGGWMVYACSWESGQDISSRFGPQQTGGTIIQHVRPVDLQASLALSAEILARWATILADNAGTSDTAGVSGWTSELSSEATWWRTIARYAMPQGIPFGCAARCYRVKKLRKRVKRENCCRPQECRNVNGRECGERGAHSCSLSSPQPRNSQGK